MTQETIIKQVDSTTFETQKYFYKDENIIPSFYLDTIFSSSVDYIEYNIFDQNQNIINSDTVLINNTYTVINGDIILDPENNLKEQNIYQGSYYMNYNFFRKRLSSNNIDKFYYISEISSDRKELRLSSNNISNELISSSFDEFNFHRENSNYFVDFYLNFGNNNLFIANNIRLDKTQENLSLLIKLYEPLSSKFDIKDILWVVEPISDPQTYFISLPEINIEIVDYEYIKGPNFNIDINNQMGSSTQLLSFNDLFNSPLTSSQQYINNILNQKGIDVNIDYEDFSNFIHFSSAKTRLENFYYKASLIELYKNQISSSLESIVGGTTGSYAYSSSKDILNYNINSIIESFDGYENFLYYNSGSLYSWPKSNITPPYSLYSTGSAVLNDWLINMYNNSYDYDQNNQNWLYWNIPEYLRNDSENRNYELFLDMIGHHFDNIWIYIDSITDKFNADNRINYGVSKNIVADVIRDFGIKLYSNSFNINDLYTSFLGMTLDGNLFPFPNITDSMPASSGYEYIDTKISSSNNIVPLDDLNKRIYKRIYHNLPYLVKTKGTLNGLKTLITSYGIPDTILKINEYGIKNQINFSVPDSYYNISNYALDVRNGNNISFSMTPHSDFGVDVPSTIQFRFKTDGIPSSSNYIQNIFVGSSPSGSVLLSLEYTGSGYISGSYSGSIPDEYNKYGTLKFIPSSSNPNISSSLYLPFFDENWWSIQVGVDYSSSPITSSIYASNREVSGSIIDYYSSSEWNNLYYIDFPSVPFYTLNSKEYTSFSGSLQEIRLYKNILSESIFNSFVSNPLYFQANSVENTPDELIFRAPLGSLLDISGSSSIHPKVTGSWIPTSSFNTGDSDFYLLDNLFISNQEKIYYTQPVIGLNSNISEKIIIENNQEPEGNTLSKLISIQQKNSSSNYTSDSNYIEIGFSPQDQINIDIINQLGNFNIGEYIGDPRQLSNKSYPDLNSLRELYFKKYISNYNLIDFIRLIKYFDNSLFKMIKDFIPAKINASTGIIIKPHILERSKHVLVQAEISSSYYTSSVKNIPNNYQEDELLYKIEGGTGGSFDKDETDQIWEQNTIFPYNLTSSNQYSKTINDNREFYNGEIPNSFIHTKLTEYCQKYKTSDTSSFDHDFDCQPYLNNIEDARPNMFLQDVDYTTNLSTPVNIQLLLSGTAINATVPESNYTIKRHRIPRYDGSRVSSDGFNSTGSLIGAYDNYPPVESKKYYMGYINEIQDPYPVVNDKTNFRVKYIIDKDTNIDNPSLNEITYYNMIDSFNERENIKVSLNIPKNESQFIKLTNEQSIYRTGKIAVPILYSQTASNGWALEIPLSQSQYIEILPLDHSVSINENLSASLYTQLGANYFDMMPISISENKTYVENSIAGTLDDPSLNPGYIEFQNSPSINYSMELDFTITSSIPTPFEYGCFHFWPYYIGYGGETISFNPNAQSLSIILKYNDNELAFKDAETDFSSDFINSNGFTFFVDSTLVNYISTNYPTTNNIVWKVNMKIDNGNLEIYTPYSFGGNFTNLSSWPCLSFNQIQNIPTTITVLKEGTADEGNAGFTSPYWMYNVTSSGINNIETYNKLSLYPPIGTLLYNKNYYQSNIPYTASLNPRFLSGREPIDTQFPKINDEWKLEPGDQIRFENNEDKVFTIKSTSIEWDSSAQRRVLTITLDREVPKTINLDFFLIRRWKEDRNNITINQTFPYSNQLISASLAPSTTGFIFPKYPVDAIAKNPDKIIRDLIDKKIIE